MERGQSSAWAAGRRAGHSRTQGHHSTGAAVDRQPHVQTHTHTHHGAVTVGERVVVCHWEGRNFSSGDVCEGVKTSGSSFLSAGSIIIKPATNSLCDTPTLSVQLFTGAHEKQKTGELNCLSCWSEALKVCILWMFFPLAA